MWALPNINAMNAQAKAEAPNLELAVRLGLLNATSQTFKTKRTLWSFVRRNLTAEALVLFDLLDPRQRSLLGTEHEHELQELAPRVWPAQDDKALKVDGLTVYLGDPLECEWAETAHLGACSGELYHNLVYDIFSDDPKSILTLCERHEHATGSPSEGYFECAICQRVMAENYTWEYYRVITDDGDVLCLKCAADEYIADDSNWLELTPENIAEVDFDRVRKAKHVIGVEMPVPKSIVFVGNVEMDGSSGGKLRTTMHADPNPNDAVDDVRTALLQALEDGHKRALLILDAAYQFSVSIGVYVDAPPAQVNQPVAGDVAVA